MSTKARTNGARSDVGDEANWLSVMDRARAKETHLAEELPVAAGGEVQERAARGTRTSESTTILAHYWEFVALTTDRTYLETRYTHNPRLASYSRIRIQRDETTEKPIYVENFP